MKVSPPSTFVDFVSKVEATMTRPLVERMYPSAPECQKSIDCWKSLLPTRRRVFPAIDQTFTPPRPVQWTEVQATMRDVHVCMKAAVRNIGVSLRRGADQ